MALHDNRIDAHWHDIIRALQPAQRTAALRGINAGMADCVERLRYDSRHYTVTSVTQALDYVDDPAVLAAIQSADGRVAVHQATARRTEELQRERSAKTAADAAIAADVDVDVDVDVEDATRSPAVWHTTSTATTVGRCRCRDVEPQKQWYNEPVVNAATLEVLEATAPERAMEQLVKHGTVTDDGLRWLIENDYPDLLLLAGHSTREVIDLARTRPRRWGYMLKVATDAQLEQIVEPLMQAAATSITSMAGWRVLAQQIVANRCLSDRTRAAMLPAASPATVADAFTGTVGFTAATRRQHLEQLAGGEWLCKPRAVLSELSGRRRTPQMELLVRDLYSVSPQLLSGHGHNSGWVDDPITELLGERLGTSSTAWAMYAQLAPTYCGTLNALLDTIDGSLAGPVAATRDN